MAMVSLAFGFFAPLHVIGLLSVLRGIPVSRSLVLTGCLAGLCGSAALFRLVTVPDQTWLPSRPSGLIRLVSGLAVLPYLALFVACFWSFPDGYDANAYHLNLALRWLHTGSLRLDPALGWAYSFPGNAELPALFAFAAGAPNATAFGNVFSAVLLFVAVYLIALRITGEGEPSILAAVIACTIPMFIFQTFDLYVDLFGTAFILAAAALLIWRQANARLSVLLCGYAVGLAIGSKPVAWVYSALFVAFALVAVLRTKQRLSGAALLSCGIVAGGGFWVFRAVVATGNPFFPLSIPSPILSAVSKPLYWIVAIPVAGALVLAITHFGRRAAALLLCAGLIVGCGLYLRVRTVSATQARISSGNNASGYSLNALTGGTWVDYSPRALLLVGRLWSEETFLEDAPAAPDRGTGPLFPAFAMPGILFLAWQAVRKNSGLLGSALLLATVAGFLLWLFALHQVPRFAMPVMAIACAAAAPVLQLLLTHARRVLIVLFPAGLLLILLFCLASPARSLLFRFRMHDWSRSTYYGYPPIIDKLPAGSRILDHTASPASFPLAGAGLTNEVIPESRLDAVGYVAKVGPEDREDAELKSRGVMLIYDAIPRNIHPNLMRRWRIYQVKP